MSTTRFTAKPSGPNKHDASSLRSATVRGSPFAAPRSEAQGATGRPRPGPQHNPTTVCLLKIEEPVIEETVGAFHSLAEPTAQVVDAVHESGGRLVAGTRIVAREEAGISAVRGWIGQLVTVGRAYGPEFAVVTRER